MGIIYYFTDRIEDESLVTIFVQTKSCVCKKHACACAYTCVYVCKRIGFHDVSMFLCMYAQMICMYV